MTLYQYLMLSDEGQWDVICDQGIEIAQSSTADYDYILFAVDRFFVEISFLSATGELQNKNAFIEGHRLDKYVGSIQV